MIREHILHDLPVYASIFVEWDFTILRGAFGLVSILLLPRNPCSFGFII